MAPVKRYYVFHAQDGSFPMLVKHFSDLKLAQEVAAGVAGGTGFVVEAWYDPDPGISGGLEVEVRDQVAQAEGRDVRRERREAAGAAQTTDNIVEDAADAKKSEAETAKTVAKEVERIDKVIESAEKKSDPKVTKAAEAKPTAKPAARAEKK